MLMRNSLKTSSGDFIDKAPMHIPKKTPSRPHYFLAKVCNYISFISKYPLQKMTQQRYCFEQGRAQVARYQDGGNFIAASFIDICTHQQQRQKKQQSKTNS